MRAVASYFVILLLVLLQIIMQILTICVNSDRVNREKCNGVEHYIGKNTHSIECIKILKYILKM